MLRCWRLGCLNAQVNVNGKGRVEGVEVAENKGQGDIVAPPSSPCQVISISIDGEKKMRVGRLRLIHYTACKLHFH